MPHQDVQIDRKKHAEVKYRLALANSSFADIATSLGLSSSTVSSVSLGRSHSLGIEQAIAKRIGISENELWPERLQIDSEDAA